MRVLKFGGTSVATSENIQRIFKIVQTKIQSEQIIVVVSALGGVTNLLLQIGEKASHGDISYQAQLKELEKRHLNLCDTLLSASIKGDTTAKIKMYVNQLEDVAKGIYWIREMSVKTTALLLSFGEKLSSTLISDFFASKGIDTHLADPLEFILTEDQFENARVSKDESFKRMETYFSDKNGLVICPGFIASNQDGQITTLGRGGSDYTASLLAAGLQADFLEIWTDVDGLMTADPRYVKSAHTIKEISYEDAMELSHFGAKVIYPPTIQPAMDKNIPIFVKNTMNPEGHGTLISSTGNGQVINGDVIKGLSCIQNIALVNLKGSGMIGIPNFSFRLFKCLSEEKINIILITQASSEHSICIGIDNQDITSSTKSIEAEFQYELLSRKIDPLEIESNLTIIALVGSKMKQQTGVSGKLFSTLGSNGINIKAIAQGSSERNISIVIDTYQIKKALNSLHESFFLSQSKRINLFLIGVGNVGSAFIEQIRRQQDFLLETHGLKVRIVGLANSRKMVFQESGIALEHWKDTLEASNLKFSLTSFKENVMTLNLRNSLLIDNTDSSEIADGYIDFLEENISVVTPNKIACSSSYDNYLALKKTAVRKNSKFLFETNVGAGLPIISTINDLVKSGDRVHKIHAVLSGSLNFMFNEYSEETTFGKIVREAQKNGYTEPDPRIDLSGVDVKRKLLILVRESGIKMEIDEIKTNDFISSEIMNAPSVDEFLATLDKEEASFKEILSTAASKKSRIKYVASYENGKATTGLQFVDEKHPFYDLEGKDNIVLLFTDRYVDQPLVIKGAGAGAEVTASGIFADVLKFANR